MQKLQFCEKNQADADSTVLLIGNVFGNVYVSLLLCEYCNVLRHEMFGEFLYDRDWFPS